ncbi:probable high-affinity hexose transporter ght7 [Trichoderma asperellum]|uniref:Probable high-affinity hexose transporter ght7 n=1 Tax=Trichoderma asperellum TaxID=101201 RepID=A0A6V8QVS8_TRIAP|nr:probable high-affinity hexose transporter ght7 [Trichoderma asperellum]
MGRRKGGFMTIYFDQHDPSSEKHNPDFGRPSVSGLDYSPLPRVTGRSWAMGCLISFGGLIFGYDTGQISGFLEMPDFLDRFGLTAPDGTKYFSNAETAPAWIRGAMVCAYQLFITMGIWLAACFNYGTVKHQSGNSGSWRIVIGLGWIWVIGLGVGILAFPETPRFDFRHGNEERAKQTICRVYGATENHWAVHTQITEIERKLRAEDQIKNGPVKEFITMFKAPRMAYRIALGMTLQMFQQLTGANYFFYYGTTIFKSVQINSFVTQIILNSINFGVTFIGLYMVEHFGRRKSLIAGSIWMFICFMIFASVGHFMLNLQDPTLTPTPGIVLIVFACLFILGFATTWGPMIWTIQAEIFPSRYRAKGMALSTASNWIWNFCIGFFTPFITGAIDFRYGYVFAGCNFMGALIIYFFVIEGQGRTLEEIDTMYLEHVLPWKSTKWVPPPPEHMANIRRKAGVDLDVLADQESDGPLSDAANHNNKDLAPEVPFHEEHV